MTHLRYDARGNLLSSTDPLGNQSQSAYNLADQTTASVAPATGTTGSGNATTLATYLYVGGPTTQVSEIGESGSTWRTTTLAYGAEGETLSRTGSAEGVGLTYDAAYHAKVLSDGNGHATAYTYDLSGRPTQIDYPGATGTNYDRVKLTSYDPVGNLLSRTDGNGQVANYAYADADGLLTSVSYPGATANNVAIVYDAFDRPAAVNDAAGSASSSFDDLDLTTSATRTYTGLAAQAFNYTYWPDGSRHTMVNPAGTWSYAYDADGRCTSMASPAGTSYAAYLDNGWEASRTLPSGFKTAYAYNAVGALASLYNKTAGGATFSSYTGLSYDGAFNLAGMTAFVSGATAQSGTVGYAYDAKDRLLGETSGRTGIPSASYAYDAAGNPTTFRGATETFDADNQRTSGASFAYDGDGNPTTYAGLAHGFDPESRLTSRGATWTAGYRADGLRAWKQSGSTRTYFLYDGGEPVVELSASGSVTATNVFAPDGLVARQSAGVWTQYAFDVQGNVSNRLDAAGVNRSKSCYDAYGTEATQGSVGTDPFAYNAQDGYYLDRETGLYLCGHRYYDPANGRWLNRDPSGYSGGVGLYLYCMQSPLGKVDASGLKTTLCSRPISVGGLNLGGGSFGHWSLNNSTCGNMDYGPKGISISRGGAPSGAGVTCVTLPTTPGQDMCLCAHADSAQAGGKVGGQYWGPAYTGPGGFSGISGGGGHNCQNFTEALLGSCGIGCPWTKGRTIVDSCVDDAKRMWPGGPKWLP